MAQAMTAFYRSRRSLNAAGDLNASLLASSAAEWALAYPDVRVG